VGREAAGARGRAGRRPGRRAGCARPGEARGVGERRTKRKEIERGGGSARGSKSDDQRLQNLGHHGGEREVGERGSCCAEELNEGKRDKGRGCMGEGQGRQGRAGHGRVASRGQKPTTRTTTDQNPIREMKTETRLGKHAIKHDIRQKKYDST
jgi:hypothetical protein